MHPKPKKRLGQNFLIDANIRRKIVSACQIHPSDVLVEIGAGRGELTRMLAAQAAKVYAVELDPALAAIVKEECKEASNLVIVNRDVLKLDLKKEIGGSGTKIKVIGNIPYYISTPIIENLLQYRDLVSDIYITVQKEFGRRVCSAAGSKEYGSLSCFVRYHAEPKIMFYITRSCFRPAPKIDSCFLHIRPRPYPGQAHIDERLLFKIIRAAFNQRRKTLRNSLAGVVCRQKLEHFFRAFRHDHGVRPEQLSLEEFIYLASS
ncbi:MAG TPA: 16S rRNA (adenine(1518)-N(6)/adenine(1519)-N(6))-dimethyltransferase RsmA [Patescibacteria group bacterium]|nr:16S rRNA (adenine(1518)-N(6)/adenine(1519)-N(6))-dimethyltransferase RsmA [Patescibacteria group bacterium]